MADPTTATDPSLLALIIGKLLDWPVLLFALILILLRKSGPTILDLFKSRKVEVELGGSKLSIGEAVEALDDETKQALDDFRKHQQEISALKSKIEFIEKTLSSKNGLKILTKEQDLLGHLESKKLGSGLVKPDANPKIVAPATDNDSMPTEKSRRDAIFGRMMAALADSRFKWRSVERLAIEAGVAEKEAHEILAEHRGEVVLGKGKSGNTIARLPDR